MLPYLFRELLGSILHKTLSRRAWKIGFIKLNFLSLLDSLEIY